MVRGLEKRHIRKAVLIAIDRLLSAAVRHYPADSIVDLAISAESLFGPKQPGEATHKISLNAALFLADDKNKASDLRKFFKNVYSVRSGIVHGGNRGESTQYGKLIEMRQQLSTWMKRAIGEAIEELIENPEALDWEQRLDRHIDSLA
ncbi:HEPN domain-containing protein [Mycobacteroides abscessus]|uniref:HEPN domain-containing protein n=1 Tax=Mycobacteroides abscessus TaxID=36809 RepID=UPI001055FA4A|nr:HEPN domain-containing protein [Mycobacteroides abscessus]